VRSKGKEGTEGISDLLLFYKHDIYYFNN